MAEADFEAMYRRSPDPFEVGTSWYEQRKQAAVLAALTRPRYRLAWDCASGTGHLAHALAERCEEVLASDAAPTAVRLAAELNGHSPHVRCRQAALPDRPDGAEQADLTLVTEVLYYLDDDVRARTLSMLAGQTGEIASVHWRHHPDDTYLSGADATDELADALQTGWRNVVRHDDADFVLAVWVRA